MCCCYAIMQTYYCEKVLEIASLQWITSGIRQNVRGLVMSSYPLANGYRATSSDFNYPSRDCHDGRFGIIVRRLQYNFH